MIRLSPRSTRTDTLLPDTTLCRSLSMLPHFTVGASTKAYPLLSKLFFLLQLARQSVDLRFVKPIGFLALHQQPHKETRYENELWSLDRKSTRLNSSH